MTKEEYGRLLQSDYWKGYSYSLIKERNFTCADCGRTFYNERNKLQVHHLVYRDVNPWSYNPDEVVVLCEECHKKRHGIVSPPPIPPNPYAVTSVSSTGENTWASSFQSRYDKGFGSYNSDVPRRRFKFPYLLLALLLPFVLYVGLQKLALPQISNVSYEDEDLFYTSMEKEKSDDGIRRRKTNGKGKKEEADKSGKTNKSFPKVEGDAKEVITAPTVSPDEVLPEVPTDNPYSDGVVRPPRTKGRSEPTSIELLEQRNHAEVVKQAKRAGVSTQGSTTDILERINHAEVVKQAKRAGVSTQGSTIDILERINHAEVVKQAKRAGVSIQGSTTDILERINRKYLEQNFN